MVRTFSGSNQLLSETAFIASNFVFSNLNTLPSLDLSLLSSNANELTNHYIYDGADRLLFTISADKRVTEYRYGDSNGTRTASEIITYDDLYTGASSPTEGNLEIKREINSKGSVS